MLTVNCEDPDTTFHSVLAVVYGKLDALGPPVVAIFTYDMKHEGHRLCEVFKRLLHTCWPGGPSAAVRGRGYAGIIPCGVLCRCHSHRACCSLLAGGLKLGKLVLIRCLGLSVFAWFLVVVVASVSKSKKEKFPPWFKSCFSQLKLWK